MIVFISLAHWKVQTLIKCFPVPPSINNSLSFLFELLAIPKKRGTIHPTLSNAKNIDSEVYNKTLNNSKLILKSQNYKERQNK